MRGPAPYLFFAEVQEHAAVDVGRELDQLRQKIKVALQLPNAMKPVVYQLVQDVLQQARLYHQQLVVTARTAQQALDYVGKPESGERCRNARLEPRT